MSLQTSQPVLPAQLIESSPAAICICDATGIITYYNSAAAALWNREPVLGKELWCGAWKIYNMDGTPMHQDTCPMALTLKGGQAVSGKEIIIERPSGERRNVLCYAHPLYDLNGNINGALDMLIDITENKQQAMLPDKREEDYHGLTQTLNEKVDQRTEELRLQVEELKKSEDRYHKMIEEVRDYAILLLDVDGTILNWNLGAEKIKGYTEKEIVGKNFKIFYLPQDRQNMVPEKLIEEARLHGKATNEGLRVRKDGSTFWGSIVITALHDDQQNIIGFSKVTRDLTEKKLAEDKLKEYAKDLEEQNRELAQFNYVASHDLQEPLRKIQTFISLCQEQWEDKAAVEKYFGKITMASKRMALLIKNLLEYSRVSEGEREFVEVDLNELMHNIEDDFELQFKAKQATIHYGTLPVIKAIPFQLYQLISNLVSNSIKFNEQQPVIEISVKMLTQAEVEKHPELNHKLTYRHIQFKDNGIGFSPVYARQIFYLFNRLHDSSQYPGSGVGLAICKKIVDNHQGVIEAEGELGKGAVFNIYLPGA